MPVSPNVYKVKTFTEKPDLDLAKAFISSGDFLWNAGIFVWQVTNICQAFEAHLPEMHDVFYAERKHFNTSGENRAIERIYPLCVNISIDFGIMEKAENVYVIPSSFGWSDLGTWNAAYQSLHKDYMNNAVSGGEVYVVDATNNMVHGNPGKLIVLQGLDDYIVVDTNDVLLICKKENEQQIKDYVSDIRKGKGLSLIHI